MAMQPKLIIGVVGAKDLSSYDPKLPAFCEALGGAIAAHDCWLLCGGTTGTMEEVPKGAQQNGGFTIGIVPKGISGITQQNKTSEWPSRYIDLALFSGLGGGAKGRNQVIIHGCDVLIALPGGNRTDSGTRSEIDLALKTGTPLILHPYWQTVKDPGPVPASPPLVDYFVDTTDPRDAMKRAMNAFNARAWTESTTARR
jgi:uncharacterized protein (TIGR00725 family)